MADPYGGSGTGIEEEGGGSYEAQFQTFGGGDGFEEPELEAVPERDYPSAASVYSPSIDFENPMPGIPVDNTVNTQIAGPKVPSVASSTPTAQLPMHPQVFKPQQQTQQGGDAVSRSAFRTSPNADNRNKTTTMARRSGKKRATAEGFGDGDSSVRDVELTPEEREKLRKMVMLAAASSGGSSCWSRAWSKRRDIAKLLVLACLVVLALGTNATAVYYIEALVERKSLDGYVEAAVRVAYPVVVLIIMWALKMYASHKPSAR